MSRFIVVTVLLVLAAAVGGWWFVNRPQPSDNGSQPSLTVLRPGGESAAGPARKVTAEPIDENVELTPEVSAPLTHPVSHPSEGQSKLKAPTADDDIPEIDVDAAKPPKSSPNSTDGRDEQKPAGTGKPGLAIIPFEVKGQVNEKDAGEILGDLLLSEIDSKVYRLFERSQLRALLTEQKFQESDLVNDAAKAAKFGRLAGIRYLVLGTLSRLGAEYHLTARVVDCETAEIGERGRVKFPSINDAADALPELVNLLGLRAGTESDAKPRPGDPPRSPSRPITGVNLIDAENPDANFQITIRTSEGKSEYFEKEHVSFVVEADRDCFVTLITRDSQGAMTLLLPNAWQPRAFVSKGKPVTIPATEAGFRFPIKPPHGKTILKAIATVKPLQLTGISAEAIKQDKFVEIPKGTKAVGLEGDPERADRRGGADLQDILKSDQWATATLVMTTREVRETATPVPPPTPVPQPPMPVTGGRDPNDVIRERWALLSKNEAASKSTESDSEWMGQATDRPQADDTVVDLLVFRAVAPGKKAVLVASPLGDMTVVPAAADGVKAIGGVDLTERIRQIKQDPTVIAVIPNRQVAAYEVAGTHLFPVQWALQSDVNPGVDVNWVRVRDRAGRIKPVPIGLVDQGFNYDDSRLSHAAWKNSEEIAGNGIDDDQNGLVDDIYGWDFYAKKPDLFLSRATINHGTLCGSIMVARPVGGRADMIGIAPQGQIIPAVALCNDPTNRSYGKGSYKAILESIAYVAVHGAKVVNLSIGGFVTNEQLTELNKIPLWDYLEKQGVLLIVAAGNEDNDNDLKPCFPANLPRSNVISVMAVDPAGVRGRTFSSKTKTWKPYSNYGSKTVHLAAPGSLIVGIPKAGAIAIGDGTSFAAPMVTAAAALVWGQHPDWDYRKVRRALLETTRPLPALKPYCASGGVLDLDAALNWSP